jgi:hypothetical protein
MIKGMHLLQHHAAKKGYNNYRTHAQKDQGGLVLKNAQ